jgi:transposase
MELKVIGIDIAKNVFQITGMDKAGKVLLRERISRKNLAVYISKLPKCLIGMESCCSTNYWVRKFRDMGHEVKVMNPKYVKPYVKTNKNDAHDSEAICEAVTRPTMRFVPIKTLEQQALLQI